MKYFVTGRVHPERANVSFARVELRLQGGGTAVTYCDSSQITVALDVQQIDGWISANIVASDVANILVGSLGFALGSGYSVEIVQVSEEDGTPHVFGVRPTGDTPDQTLAVEPSNVAFQRALHLSGKDIFFRLAVQDYLRAITDVTDCAMYCYRSIEAIKSAFVLSTGNDRWDEMHAALGTDRTAITATVKVFADPVRHGNWLGAKPTNAVERWQMLSLTRDVLVRYLDYAEPAT